MDTKVIDLSHELTPAFLEDKSKLSSVDMRSVFCHLFKPDPSTEWHIAHLFSTSSHVGTHVESPYHWAREGRDIASLPLELLTGPAIKLDFSRKRREEAMVLQELKRASRGRLRRHDMVFLQTDHCRLWGTNEYWLDSPYLSVEAAKWLVDSGVKAVGIDAPRLDCYRAQGRERYIIHEILHGNEVLVIENMTNLSELRDRGTAFVLPLKIRGLDAFPVRVVVIEEKEDKWC